MVLLPSPRVNGRPLLCQTSKNNTDCWLGSAKKLPPIMMIQLHCIRRCVCVCVLDGGGYILQIVLCIVYALTGLFCFVKCWENLATMKETNE